MNELAIDDRAFGTFIRNIENESLFDSCAKQDFNFFYLMYLTGLRAEEVLDLKLTMIKEDYIILADREVNLSMAAIAFLNEWKKSIVTENLFEYRGGSKEVQSRFYYWLNQAKVEKPFTLECFRRNYAQRLRMSGVIPEHYIQTQMGTFEDCKFRQ